MILYTPLSKEDIFPPSPSEHTNRHMISFEGRYMYCQQKTDGSLEVLQLLSSDPQDFLNENYAPGTILPNTNIKDN
ncbi:MAG: YlzJ-like family protein [Bacillota bacterium]|uniref:YlzJ-like family protein n=1 Tax=Virgibacillus salarius TaxID=447199 RepID=A0A941DSD0_9BACI|nr:MULTISPECIES: YlzJ-like family protein [Bacillaceae]NAZ07531.1 hypothetical protein [Agaribacter marinus]MBR7794811.1 YlzJ-like family protein [Virgibacillus salarius]MCC2249225.1 YlzJ-like family protein [Virgibacillus sp. AGTR]MDY7045018.1 YlzJ-like family protein [Virgibacillus sp. M23]QRZ17260.1 YlzJ-like family protein [Virgibacillus sp. AGTR]